MSNKKNNWPIKTKLFVLVAVFLTIPSLATAAGLWLYELGTPDSGMASAGRAALAIDASTAGTIYTAWW